MRIPKGTFLNRTILFQEKTSLVTKMKENINQAKGDSLKDRLIEELKNQLKDENEKLRSVSEIP